MYYYRHRILIFEIIGFVFIAGAGSAMRIYGDQIVSNFAAAFVLPISGSMWEQLKLLFFPYLLFTILEGSLFGKRYHNFIYYKAVGFLIGCFLFLIGFYLYSGIVGTTLLLIDLTLYYFSIYVMCYNNTRFLTVNPTIPNLNFVGVLIFLLITGLFVAFRFWQPPLQLFY